MTKTCLITGSTDGIGLETAKLLAAQGFEVYMHGRNPDKGAQAVAQVKHASGNDNVHFVQGDFSSLDAVRAMAAELNQNLKQLDVLINNAGHSAPAKLEYSQDGHEITFAVNHLAHFLLTNLLLDKLKQAPAARIIHTSSVGHKFAPFDIDDLMSEKTKPANAYFRAKFANILFSNELARRLEPFGITSNALHPGTIKSNFGKEALVTRIFYTVAGPFLKKPIDGARTIAYLATSDEVSGKTGGYYFNCKPAKPAKETFDQAIAEKLWLKSVELTGL